MQLEIPSTLKDIPLAQAQNVRELLMSRQSFEQLSLVATKHLNPGRMMRVMANAIRTTPALGECHPMTLLGALMQCAALGLEPNTILGHAYLIPFKNRKKGITEVTLVVGYKGLIDLARRSGHITSIHAGIHYSDDELWDYEEGTEARLRHKPGPQEGRKLHAYAIAKFVEGGHAYVVLPWSHILKIRNASQGYKTAVEFNRKDNPWMTHEDAMAKKTAIRALSKYLPLSVEFVQAVEVDGRAADYGAFAKYPEDGLTIDGEADAIDGAQEQQERKADPKDAPKPDAEAAPKLAAKPAPKPKPAAEPKPAPKPEPEPEQELDVAPETDGADEIPVEEVKKPAAKDPTQHPVYLEVQTILPDVGASTIRKGMEKQFSNLKVDEPEVWAAVDQLLTLAEQESDDGDFSEV